MDWASEQGRQWCIEHGAGREVGLSFSGATSMPLVLITPSTGPGWRDLERFLAAMVEAGDWREAVRKCAAGSFTFQWRCSLVDLARAGTNWPHDIAPRLLGSAGKALTIELNKRKHARAAASEEKHLGDLTPVMRDAEDTLARARALSARLGARDRRMEVATELIAAMRADLLAILKGAAPLSSRTIALLAEWDKLKG